MDHPKLHIETDGTYAKISINGTEIHDVRSYEIRHDACNIPILRLEINALNLDFETEWMPELPEPWCRWYEPKDQISSGNSLENEQE